MQCEIYLDFLITVITTRLENNHKSVPFYFCHVKKTLLAVAAISGNKPPGGDIRMDWIKNGKIQLNIEIWGTSAKMWLENYAIYVPTVNIQHCYLSARSVNSANYNILRTDVSY